MFKKIAESIIEKLKQRGINSYIWCVATTGSVYIRFEDAKICSIRIGDHDGKEQWKYKFNLRADVKKHHMKKDGEVWRLYYPLNDVELLLTHLEERWNKSRTWVPNKSYQYGIPKHLRNKNKENALIKN